MKKVRIEFEIDKSFTSKRAKQYVQGLQGAVGDHALGLITDQQLIITVVQKSLQMLVTVGVVEKAEEDL